MGHLRVIETLSKNFRFLVSHNEVSPSHLPPTQLLSVQRNVWLILLLAVAVLGKASLLCGIYKGNHANLKQQWRSIAGTNNGTSYGSFFKVVWKNPLIWDQKREGNMRQVCCSEKGQKNLLCVLSLNGKQVRTVPSSLASSGWRRENITSSWLLTLAIGKRECMSCLIRNSVSIFCCFIF